MDIASLGFSIDTRDVEKAETALDGLNQAGAKTEAAAKGVGSAWSDASGKAGSATQAMRQGNEAIRGQQQELGKLLGQINPVIAALDRLDEQEKQLSGFKASGLLDAETFTEYQGRIALARKGLTDFEGGLKKAGVSSAQTAQALRQLPMQFSDIFISLQAGQSPLQVLLQQGSQIKESFGGIGPALAETGRYAMALVNPYTLAAAAAVALGVAWKQGSDEAVAYNKALILTGNAAGTSADQLATYASAISGVVGTQGQAAEVLAQMAGTGKIASDQLQLAATSAIEFERATGTAVEDSVKAYARLAEEPAKASIELSKSLNYLTAETYEQIAALEAQGRTSEAASVAIRAYAEAQSTAAKDIEENLGLLESAWKGIVGEAAKAWDAMLGVGREATLDERLSELRERLQTLDETGGGGRGGRFQFGIGGDGGNGGREDTERQIALLELEQEERDGIARQQAELVRINKEAVSAQEALNKGLADSRSNAEKLKAEYANIDKLVSQAAAGGVQYSQAQIDQLRAAAAERFKDPEPRKVATKKPEAFRDDAATKLLMSLREQESSLSAQLVTEGKLTAEQKKRVEFEQQIADLKTKDVLTADQQSLLANQDAIRAQLDKNVAIAEEVKLRQQAADEAKKLAAFEQTLADQLASARDGLDLQVAGQGMGREQAQRLQEQLRIEQQFNRQQSKLQEQFNRGDISESLYNDESQALQQALNERLAMQQDYYRKVDEAQGDWSNGASAAMQDYLDSAKDVSEQTYGLFSDALYGLEDVFVEFATTGKASFSDLMNSIAADIARMGFRSLIGEALSLGGVGASAGGNQGTGGLLTSLTSMFAGLFDSGGSIPAGQWGIVGEKGPEIVSGPAVVTSRQDTARMMGGSSVSVGQMVFPGITNANEARIATAQAGRELARTVAAAGRYA